jgi:serine/threonine protein kinase
MLAFRCPQCGVPLRVEDRHAGQPVQCGGCHHVLKAPAVCVPASAEAANGTDEDVELGTLLPSLPGGSAAANASPPAGQDSYGQIIGLLAPARSADELGRLGWYRVLSVLGVGGMSVVFRAEDTQLQRRVALKVLLPALIANPTSRERFLREARALAAIAHDHVVALYQVSEERGIPFLAMQLLEGESLEDRLRREGRLPIREVLRIGREAAAGLAAIHARGVIHRDIKPANLWLEGGTGRVKVFDFGLACSVQGGAHLTKPGTVLGTPGYMAPEQIRGGTVDQRTDLFSLGCVLYRLCTGELPFKGTDTISMLAAIATQTPRPLQERNAAVPGGLATLVMQLLSKEPDGRPPSASAVVAAITSIESAEPVPVPPRIAAASPVGRPRMTSAPSREPSQRTPNESAALGPVVLDDDPTAKLTVLDGVKNGKKPGYLLPLFAGCIVLLGVALIGTGSFAAWWLLRDRPGESPVSSSSAPHPDEPKKGGEERWTVLFRSDNPRLWNTDSDGKDYAISLRRAPATIHHLRLRRMDTKEMLILPLSRAQLDKANHPAEPKGYSWNGTAKEEWGALHLGIAAAPRHQFPIPRNMITLMNEGWDGWGGSGFGHQAFNDRTGQYYAWRGEQIPRTVFEIAVTDQPLTPEEERCLLKP